ncbi:MAG TPA: RNA 2',3'-cyclic phosphodiesterase [Solirubrobacteraceae bacterium]|nr:RNA 2',3'-cyclic phosphodiesterase [Solirubrobacteraceae bacterium]
MSRGATARLFVALDPPQEVCEELAAWARSVASGSGARPTARHDGRPMRVLEARSLHLTLCFLGNRPVTEIDALPGALAACAEPVGELSVGAPLWLPSRRPRSLAVEIGDRDGRLDRLQRSLVDALAGASGWEPERRRFRAHVTVARVRDMIAGAHDLLPATPRLSFTPDVLALYRSRLAPTGAEYEALATCRLAESAACDRAYDTVLGLQPSTSLPEAT